MLRFHRATHAAEGFFMEKYRFRRKWRKYFAACGVSFLVMIHAHVVSTI